jgi:hypothetical protein
MNRPDGSTFSTLEEFCEHRQPWGLGKPYSEIEPFLIAAVGRVPLIAMKATTPNPAGRGGNKVDDGKPCSEAKTKGGNDPEYLMSRLRRDHPAIADAAAAGKYKSVRAAAVEAGIVKPLKPADPVKAATKALARVPPERMAEVTSAVMGLSVEHLRALLTIVDGLLKAKGES